MSVKSLCLIISIAIAALSGKYKNSKFSVPNRVSKLLAVLNKIKAKGQFLFLFKAYSSDRSDSWNKIPALRESVIKIHFWDKISVGQWCLQDHVFFFNCKLWKNKILKTEIYIYSSPPGPGTLYMVYIAGFYIWILIVASLLTAIIWLSKQVRLLPRFLISFKLLIFFFKVFELL